MLLTQEFCSTQTDGDSLLDLLKGWLNVVLELVSLLAFPTLFGYTTVFTNKVLSMLLCAPGSCYILLSTQGIR